MGIVDTYGNPITATKPPEGKLVTIPINEIVTGHPANELTPRALARLLSQAESGYIEEQMALAEDIEERDWHIASVLQTRKRAVAGLPWDVLPADESDRAKEIAEFVEKTLKGLQFVKARQDLMDAVFKGVAVLDIEWQNNGRYVVPAALGPIHSTLLDYSDGVLKIEAESTSVAEEPPPFKVIEHRYRAKAGTVMRGGLVRMLAWAYVLKHFSVRAWLIFAEVCGMPLRIGKYPEAASDDQKSVLKRAVRDIGLDFAAIVPEGMQIEFIEAVKNSGQAVFEPLARYIDAGITRLVLGQTLTTQGGEGGVGSLALGQVHALVAQDLLENDAGYLEETFQRQLVEPVVAFNFGADAPMPELHMKAEAPLDLKFEAEIDEKLVNMNLPLPVSYFYDRYGRPKPAEGEEILTPPSPAPGLFGGEEDKGLKPAGPGARAITGKVRRPKAKAVDLERSIVRAFRKTSAAVEERIKAVAKTAMESGSAERFFESIEEKRRPWEMISSSGERLFGLMARSEQKGREGVRGRRTRGAARVTGSFDLVPARAMDFHRLQAFWISDVTDDAVLQGARATIERALASGTPWGEVRGELGGILGGDFGPRLETIFRTNAFQAYNGGKFWEGQEARDALPYWQYFTVQDDRVRPTHAALHGKIYPKDDAVWQSIFPPNGFGCRCTVEEASSDDLRAEGLEVSRDLPEVPETGGYARADFGWDHNPAMWEQMFKQQMATQGFQGRKAEDYGLKAMKAWGKAERWDVSPNQRLERAERLLKPREGYGSIVDFEGVRRTVSMTKAAQLLSDERRGAQFPLAIEAMKAPDEVWGTMVREGDDVRPDLWLLRSFGSPRREERIAVNLARGEFASYSASGEEMNLKRAGTLLYKRAQ